MGHDRARPYNFWTCRKLPLTTKAIAGRKILFLALVDWNGTFRLLEEFKRLGCECAVMGPPGFTIAATRFASTLFRLPSHGRGLPKLRLLASRFRLEKANREGHPDLIVPLDDFAAWLLRGLATDRSVSAKLRHLLEVSLGSPSGYDAACSRTQFLELATKIGVRVPASRAVDRIGALGEAAAMGFPVMVKSNQTTGGDGVTIARDPECVNPDPFGPSTVVRYLDHPEMEATATRLVAALGLSGFASFDFVIAEDGGGAFLIELNPRTIGTIHLGRLFGHDLCGAFARHLGWLFRRRLNYQRKRPLCFSRMSLSGIPKVPGFAQDPKYSTMSPGMIPASSNTATASSCNSIPAMRPESRICFASTTALWRPWPEAVVDLRSGGSDRLRLGSTCEAIPKSTIIPATPVAIAPPPPQ
jgi:Carbamoyl-phosphate synthase L chain, ATP binding domain